MKKKDLSFAQVWSLSLKSWGETATLRYVPDQYYRVGYMKQDNFVCRGEGGSWRQAYDRAMLKEAEEAKNGASQ